MHAWGNSTCSFFRHLWLGIGGGSAKDRGIYWRDAIKSETATQVLVNVNPQFALPVHETDVVPNIDESHEVQLGYE